MNLPLLSTTKEKFFFYNTLSILLKAVENKKTTIDLRNEAYIFGTVHEVDGYMNVVMSKCIFTDPVGNKFKFDTFFVQARNIRCVHIPPNIRMVPAINEQLGRMKHQMKNPLKNSTQGRTLKMKKIQQKLTDDKAEVQNILQKKEK
ncbi:U7 snRNA-associated Sm-like protein LSm10 [Chelonus insularis]|uniref:U7 snRNA-associated Sm-like protein LSm10 n=1 Tax=Chelonus insularis TaxID=460826 RepID=UPI00158CF5F2|nr:U7 snRNA-associated Sm-like protein LSm10 [Chelonus insularis]